MKTPSHEATTFELQLMGPKMGEGKELDDVIYKTLHNKEVNKKYHEIVDTINRLKTNENEPALARFNRYRSDALFDLRKQEMTLAYNKSRNKKSSKKERELFIDEGKYILTPEYGLNALYKKMLELM